MLKPGRMEWVAWLWKASGIRRITEWSRRCGTTHSHVIQLMERKGPRLRRVFELLCNGRALSGQSWEQVGKVLDAEFLSIDHDRVKK